MKERHNFYSNFYVLVCNHNGKDLSRREKMIIEGMKKEWADAQNDSNHERIHIIFLDPKDGYIPSEKFASLREINNFSKVYIVGFGRPEVSAHYIESDPVYPTIKSGKKDYISYQFLPRQLAKILFDNIQDTNVKIPRNEVTPAMLSEPTRRLKICITACNTAKPVVDVGTIQNPEHVFVSDSFAEKMFNYMYNIQDDFILLCDISAANAIVVPIPTASGNTISTLLFFSPYFEKTTVDGFHKQYMKEMIDSNGIPTLNPRRWLPTYQPDDEYKLLFVTPKGITQSDITNRKILPEILSVSDAKKRLQEQSRNSDEKLKRGDTSEVIPSPTELIRKKKI